jgi:Ran GTPase-activating protein (RanGAP) involved in mRNA processing and transport
MNSLDLFGGGQQINRGYKYLIDNKYNTEKSKLLCVICNKIKFSNSNKKNKAYKLFEVGYENNTLCYIKNIGSIINKYFN